MHSQVRSSSFSSERQVEGGSIRNIRHQLYMISDVSRSIAVQGNTSDEDIPEEYNGCEDEAVSVGGKAGDA
jgi:hypothetical protein